MNILDKFENVIIENKSKIDKEDREYCEKYDNIYKETLECYKNILNNLVILYNKHILIIPEEYQMYISRLGNKISICNIIEDILSLKEKHIYKICYYFKKKYNVTIDENKIYKKYKDIELIYSEQRNRDKTFKTDLIKYIPLDYNIILDEIFIQLDGCTFWERAVNEIIQKARTPRYYYEYQKYWSYDIKGRTIKFRTNIENIKPALYFYDSNETKMLDCYSYNKVSDFKYYDNGNTDVKFVNPSYALEFAKKYLGYIENN